MMAGSADSPEAFAASLKTEPFVRFALDATGMDERRLRGLTRDAVGELPTGLDLLRGRALAGLRILEVGAGASLLALLLRSRGLDVTALEPGAGGLGDVAALGRAVRAWLPDGASLNLLDSPAEDLRPERHGRFDVIFSTNVLEHIPKLDAAFAAMTSVLAPGGLMVHRCPNYAVPWEPHYGIPVLPFWPGLTARLGRNHPEVPPDVWSSLNFVTATRVRRLARANGLDAIFRRRLLEAEIRRLGENPAFLARQRPIVARAASTLRALRLGAALGLLPPALATPMEFECRRPPERGANAVRRDWLGFRSSAIWPPPADGYSPGGS